MQKTEIRIVCDFDGLELAEGQHYTRHYVVDGKEREIDLCAKHNAMFDKALERFNDKARVASTVHGRPRRRTVNDRNRSSAIRDWAREHGERVSDRGRIPTQIVAKYELATH